MEGNPQDVEGTPPEHGDATAPDAGGEENPERQGPGGQPGPADAPTKDPAEDPAGADEAPSGPPPESVPGDESQGTSPRE
jgi:hypothetical protein